MKQISGLFEIAFIYFFDSGAPLRRYHLAVLPAFVFCNIMVQPIGNDHCPALETTVITALAGYQPFMGEGEHGLVIFWR